MCVCFLYLLLVTPASLPFPSLQKNDSGGGYENTDRNIPNTSKKKIQIQEKIRPTSAQEPVLGGGGVLELSVGHFFNYIFYLFLSPSFYLHGFQSRTHRCHNSDWVLLYTQLVSSSWISVHVRASQRLFEVIEVILERPVGGWEEKAVSREKERKEKERTLQKKRIMTYRMQKKTRYLFSTREGSSSALHWQQTVQRKTNKHEPCLSPP